MNKPRALSGDRLVAIEKFLSGCDKGAVYASMDTREMRSLLAEIRLSREIMDGLDEDYLPGNLLPKYRAYEAFLDSTNPDPVAAFDAMADAGGAEAYKDVDAEAFVDELRGHLEYDTCTFDPVCTPPVAYYVRLTDNHKAYIGTVYPPGSTRGLMFETASGKCVGFERELLRDIAAFMDALRGAGQ